MQCEGVAGLNTWPFNNYRLVLTIHQQHRLETMVGRFAPPPLPEMRDQATQVPPLRIPSWRWQDQVRPRRPKHD